MPSRSHLATLATLAVLSVSVVVGASVTFTLEKSSMENAQLQYRLGHLERLFAESPGTEPRVGTENPLGTPPLVDLTTVRVGDKFGKMIVVKETKDKSYLGPGPIGNAAVTFSGAVTVSGNFAYKDKDAMQAEKVCLILKNNTEIPNWSYWKDPRSLDLCLEDRGLDKTAFGTPGRSGTITATIDTFTLVSEEVGEGIANTAELRNILDISLYPKGSEPQLY